MAAAERARPVTPGQRAPSPTRGYLEGLLIACTSLKIAAALLPARPALAVFLVALTVLSLLAEFHTEKPSVMRANVRPADSAGTALGAMLLPWVMSALSMQTAPGIYGSYGAVLSMSSSAAFLACLSACGDKAKQADSDEGQGQGSRRERRVPPSPRGSRRTDHCLAACGAVFSAAVILQQTWLAGASMCMCVAAMFFGVVATGLAFATVACLPLCFTLGEALVLSEACSLLLWATAPVAWEVVSSLGSVSLNEGEAAEAFVGGLLSTAVLGSWACGPSLIAISRARLAGGPAPRAHTVAVSGFAFSMALLAIRPALWALAMAFSTPHRRMLVASWAGLLAVSVPLIFTVAKRKWAPKILIRKMYHALAAAIFLPGAAMDSRLLAVAAAVACAALVAVEFVRVGRLPPFGEQVHSFMTSFVDSRDSGTVYVSHFSLLIGMSAPVWLVLPLQVEAEPTLSFRTLVCASACGAVALGVTDTAASAVGIGIGHTPVHPGAKKTVEGLVGGIAATLLAWAAFCHAAGLLDGGTEASLHEMVGMLAATVGVGVLEALTTQLDNNFLPMHFLALLLT